MPEYLLHFKKRASGADQETGILVAQVVNPHVREPSLQPHVGPRFYDGCIGLTGTDLGYGPLVDVQVFALIVHCAKLPNHLQCGVVQRQAFHDVAAAAYARIDEHRRLVADRRSDARQHIKR